MPARLLDSPALLLLVVGTLLGCNFPLARLAQAAAIPPLAWALVISGGGALVLGAAALVTSRGALPLDRRHARFFAVTAVLSYAVPNVLVVALIPRLGSGYTAMLFTLSPMLTVTLSALLGLAATRRLELIGIGVGFVGAMLVASARGEAGREADWGSIALGFVVPLSLACGNVYRTLDWPPEGRALWLAAGSNAAAALLLLAALLALGESGAALAALAEAPGLVALQGLVSAAMLGLFFRLQAIGGPVTLSQIGTVAAAVGVLAGTLGFAERYPALAWAGVAVIAAGIALTVRAKLAERTV